MAPVDPSAKEPPDKDRTNTDQDDSTSSSKEEGQQEVPVETGSNNSSQVAPLTSVGPVPAATWARVAKQKPLQVKVTLVKNEDDVRMSLTPAEKGKLVKQLGVPAGKLLGICDARQGMLLLIIDQSVQRKDLNLETSYKIRNGLWTKPLAPIVQEKCVKLYWTDYNLDNTKITEAMSYFGKLTSRVQHQTYRAGDKATEDEKLLDGTMKGDRYFWMKLARPIPTYILIDGKRCKVNYEHQDRTCPRCHKTRFECVGKANASECEKNGGEKVEIERFWEELTTQSVDDTEGRDMGPNEFIRLSNIPEGASKSDISKFLLDKRVDVDDDQLKQIGDTVWSLSGLMAEELKCLLWSVGSGEKMMYGDDDKLSEKKVKVTLCSGEPDVDNGDPDMSTDGDSISGSESEPGEPGDEEEENTTKDPVVVVVDATSANPSPNTSTEEIPATPAANATVVDKKRIALTKTGGGSIIAGKIVSRAVILEEKVQKACGAYNKMTGKEKLSQKGLKAKAYMLQCMDEMEQEEKDRAAEEGTSPKMSKKSKEKKRKKNEESPELEGHKDKKKAGPDTEESRQLASNLFDNISNEVETATRAGLRSRTGSEKPLVKKS